MTQESSSKDVLALASVFAGRRYEHYNTGLRKRIAPALARGCTD